MAGKRLALFFFLVFAMELSLCAGNGSPHRWRRRFTRRRWHTPPTTTPKPTSKPCDTSVPGWITWANKWHKPFNARCADAYSMSQWISVYRACQEDRISHFRCRLISTYFLFRTTDCNWTPHVLHDVNHSFFYKCPDNGFITGVKSFFDKAAKDRRISLKCCKFKELRHRNCRTTGYMNSFGAWLYYVVPRDYIMVGVGSYHSVASSTFRYSDRRWMFEICQFKFARGN